IWTGGRSLEGTQFKRESRRHRWQLPNFRCSSNAVAKSKSSGSKVQDRAKRVFQLTFASSYAASYVTLTFVLSGVSYGEVNLRLANILLALVPLIGRPAILGHTIGVFAAGTLSPLGPVDLINVLPALVFS